MGYIAELVWSGWRIGKWERTGDGGLGKTGLVSAAWASWGFAKCVLLVRGGQHAILASYAQHS